MSVSPESWTSDSGKKNQPGTRPTTRQDTRKTGTTVINKSQEEIKDARSGRIFLEGKLYLCPAGQPTTHTSITYCLHQISAMQGVTKPTKNEIRAVAYLLEEMEDYTLATLLRDTVNEQLSTMTEDLSLITTDIKEKMDNQLEEKLADLDKSMDRINRVIGKLEKAEENTPRTGLDTNSTQVRNARSTRTYADTLVAPPSHADPRLAAKEGIKVRQLMLEGTDDNPKMGEMDNTQLKEELNRITRSLGLESE
jgi:hypothetical protein